MDNLAALLITRCKSVQWATVQKYQEDYYIPLLPIGPLLCRDVSKAGPGKRKFKCTDTIFHPILGKVRVYTEDGVYISRSIAIQAMREMSVETLTNLYIKLKPTL